jgi:hypothetical protein
MVGSNSVDEFESLSNNGTWILIDFPLIKFLYHANRSTILSQPYFWKSGKMTLTLPKWGLGSPPGLLKL